LLLAAGGSSRLGRPKQLVEWDGKPLIKRASEALLGADCYPVMVVLCPSADAMRAALDGLALNIVENPEWEKGQSSSIRTGMDSLLAIEPLLEAVLIALADQPTVSAKHLRCFIEHYSSAPAPIIAAEYGGFLGVPALFDRSHFPALAELVGDKGARELIRNEAGIISIALPEASVDIDTIADLANLLGS
jgi:molybdenum cofactor cytidylyltransferase